MRYWELRGDNCEVNVEEEHWKRGPRYRAKIFPDDEFKHLWFCDADEVIKVLHETLEDAKGELEKWLDLVGEKVKGNEWKESRWTGVYQPRSG